MSTRFIDLAQHGGCSKKIGAKRLSRILETVSSAQSVNSPIRLWEDVGIFENGDGSAHVSNVDIVLPMINDPSDFGEIVVAHVLSDIYASGGVPQFGLNILEIPELENFDLRISEMLNAGAQKLQEAGAILVGGHTLEADEMKYGLAVFGIVPSGSLVRISGAQIGDALILTKKLGTSVASKLWRMSEDHDGDFQDVLMGMKQLNNVASEEMKKLGVHACTDISGYGLAGHAHNMFKASNISGRIYANELPIYESAQQWGDDQCYSRLLQKNLDYVRDHIIDKSFTYNDFNLYGAIYDAQVSGGLLISLSAHKAQELVDRLTLRGIDAKVIGEICAYNQHPGEVEIV